MDKTRLTRGQRSRGLNRGAAAGDDKPQQKRRRHPLIGSMKGTFTIAPGVDLTEPAMPEWADLIDEKYGKDPNE